ncbi:VCBS repeat-containing protein [Streptomyces sp. NBC_01789]|uniref:FG-GAP repeat domain-containing protein n=2 Tax=unclassified Streptomyces TaxID=2593676 RepID=UPI00225462C5|nr:VCBS repeat-containing protein [Streptomyces sp. NBC_01789]MCX4448700.1 VCBS repeat-containing protein [Streptomyces sp. NBC_01789]
MEPGRSVPRPKRARRIAACTALVLSAGMLLAAPASADDSAPAPAGATPQFTPERGGQPTLTLPKRTAKKKSGASRAPGAQSPSSVVPANPRLDLDGDGYSDMMYRGLDGNLYASTDASGTHPYQINSNDQYEMPKDIITPGDLDGGGMAEVLTLSASGTLSLYQSWGADSTGYVTWSGNGWQKYNKVVAPGDLDGDGRGDLLARTPSGDLYTYVSTGKVDSAPFKAGVKAGYGWNIYDQVVGANDVNGDGLGDVIARTPSGDVYFYAGTGDASKPFKARVKVGYGWDIYNQLVGMDDIDGDGLGDLIARKPGGDVYTYFSTGYGTFEARVAGGKGWNAAALFVGAGGNPDFGKHELEARTKGGSLYWYQARNNGQFFPRQLDSSDTGWNQVSLSLASSLDNDGWGELTQIYKGTLWVGAQEIGSGWQVYNSLTGPGDLSGDGKGDLLARDTKGDLYLYKGNGLGTKFAAKVKVGYGFSAYNKIVGAGDLSGDGIADVVARAKDGTLYLYKGTGNAAKPLSARSKIGTGYNIYKQFAAPGDTDGDGKADLIGVDGKGDVYRYSSTGTGQISKRVKIGYGWDIYNGLY